MKIFLKLGVAAALRVLPDQQSLAEQLVYPEAPRGNDIDTYTGSGNKKVQVVDPYRLFEDLKSTETQNWVKNQNKMAYGYLKKLKNRNFFSKLLRNL